MIHHIFLSPHIDDAVLSCAGYIESLHQQGQTVKVITFFADIPQPEQGFSEFAQYQHQMWGQSPKLAYQTRRSEDKAALDILGLQPIWLPFLDAIYRRDEAGNWLYTSNETLFGSLNPADADLLLPKLLAQLKNYLPSPAASICYAPFAIGKHVDHQLIYRLAQTLQTKGYTLQFYEDYPYIQRKPTDLNPVLAGKVWHSQRCFFAPEILQTKLQAISAYTSQITLLFGDTANMRQQVENFALFRGQGRPAERFWYLAL